MQISVNGNQREMAENATIEQLLQELSLTGPLAVELNSKVCPKRLHGQTQLKSGDVLEIVTIVGGG